MTLDSRLLKTDAAANSLLSPNKRISSSYDINVTLGATAAAIVALGVGYPIGYNKSTGDHGLWTAPDPTVAVITLTGATGGTFTITVNDATTAALAYDATAVVVAAALKAIGYDVSVVLASLIYTLTFDGQAEIESIPTVTADLTTITGDVTESATVNDGTAQIASPTVLNISLGITVIATGGTFTVTYDGNTSAAIAWDASALDIRTAILAIGTHAPDSVTVTRDSLASIAISFDDEDDLLTLPTVSATLTSLTGATGEEAQVTVGDVLSIASASDVEVDIGTATGGTFTITVNGATTGAIAFDAAVGVVDAALLAIGYVVSTALVSTTYTITFSSKNEVISLPTLSGSISLLTGAVVAIVVTAGTSTAGTDEIRGFINPEDVSTSQTLEVMAVMMVKGVIHATLPESLVASGDVTALRTAMTNGLVEKGLIVQGLAGRF